MKIAALEHWTPTSRLASRVNTGMALAGFFLLLGAPLLGGCTGSLFSSKQPAAQIYVLMPETRQAPAVAQPGAADLVLSITSASPGLSSEHIAALRPGRRLDYFDHALWGSSAPRILQAFLINSLQNQGRFRSVISDDTRVAAPYVIDTDLRDFQAEYVSPGAPPTVRVTIVALLMRVQDRALVRMIPVTATARAESDRLGAVVEAFETAATEVAALLGDQLTDALQDGKPELRGAAAPDAAAPGN